GGSRGPGRIPRPGTDPNSRDGSRFPVRFPGGSPSPHAPSPRAARSRPPVGGAGPAQRSNSAAGSAERCSPAVPPSRTRISDLKQRVTQAALSLNPSWNRLESNMSEMNGSLQMEHALLFTFLEVSPDCQFRAQLQSYRDSLQRQQMMFCQGSDDDELQIDGNRSGHFQNGELEVAATNEEVIRIIAAQLAEIGDQLNKEIQGRVVEDLVQHVRNETLSKEEIALYMSRAVNELIRSIPLDMAQEKAMLVLAMVLTKKIVNTVPSLLQRVCNATVNYMNQQFHEYIAEMLREIHEERLHHTFQGSIATCCQDSGPRETGRLSVCQLWLADRDTGRLSDCHDVVTVGDSGGLTCPELSLVRMNFSLHDSFKLSHCNIKL
ncbi:BH3-interacting domain death agonist, partial [Lamprotornis superbus]